MQQTVHSLLQTADGVLWAGAADGLWRSEDSGTAWQRAAGLPAMTVLRLGVLALPDGKSWLWAGTEGAGLWVSDDGGANWRSGGLAGRGITRLLADPARPGWLLAASDAGLFTAPMP
jgi:ligand-binding sensor domain-containing protein